MYASIGYAPDELERRVRERLLEDLERELDPPSLQEALAEGGSWSQEEAVVGALS